MYGVVVKTPPKSLFSNKFGVEKRISLFTTSWWSPPKAYIVKMEESAIANHQTVIKRGSLRMYKKSSDTNDKMSPAAFASQLRAGVRDI